MTDGLKNRLDMLSEGANPGPYGTESYGSGTTYITLGEWVGHFSSDTVSMMGGGRAEIVNRNVPSDWGDNNKKGHTATFLAQLANSYREGKLKAVDDTRADLPAAVTVKPLVWEFWTAHGKDAAVGANAGANAETPFGGYQIISYAEMSESRVFFKAQMIFQGDYTDCKPAAKEHYEGLAAKIIDIAPAPVAASYDLDYSDFNPATGVGDVIYVGGRKYVAEDMTEQLDAVQEAARVLRNHTPNPIFDDLKGSMIGEFSWSRVIYDENDDEITETLTVPWDVCKDILSSALRTLSEGGA